ncbi:hypothetical protein PFISCL1PPCAC_2564, partial [Pristionchus fissidentatus]
KMVGFLLMLLPIVVLSAPTERELEEKKAEMRDYIIFRFAVQACEVPSECQDKVMYSLNERIPPHCDTARSDLLNCLKREIHSHRAASDFPLELDSICCSFESAGPLCPEVCKTSLRTISLTPLQIHNNIVAHCSSSAFTGDTKIRQCIETARHIHSHKKECTKTP